MDTSKTQRHKLIKNLMGRHAEKVSEASITLWELLAIQITSIVGEGGFNSLFTRSVLLTQTSFSWLEVNPLALLTANRFTTLKRCFDGQTPAYTKAANSQLLITFTDILASLVGEQITTTILHSAWGNDVSDESDMEKKHEQ
ncbi:MAG: hypothetical protein WC742_04020 [Gallionellaceae bacterium]|jgi:hypothetical protein